MNIQLRLAVLSLFILTVSPASATEQEAFLAPQKAAAILADGLPWSALDPDGTKLKFTLLKDGTGSVRGPMPFTLSINWMVKDDQFCIDGKMGTKCLRFRAIPGGLQGWDGDKPGLTFSR